MLNFEKEETKKYMLKEMENNCWNTEVDENSSYEDIEAEYNEMINELESAEDAMFPNGRDYDAENFDN